MKTLLLARHAKANPVITTDFERTLSERGKNDAEFIANIVAEKIKQNNQDIAIFSSPANRALNTAQIFAKHLNYPNNKIVTDLGIYEKGAKYIIKTIAALNDKINSVIIFGHNPDIISLISYFIGDFVDDVPTCGIACIDFDIDNWKKTENENGILRFFEIPKKYLV